MAYLRHAAGCQPCSDLLAHVLPPDLTEASPEEEGFLRQLTTSTAAGQQRLAARMFDATRATAPAPAKVSSTGKRLYWSALAAAAGLAIAAVLVVPRLMQPSDATLIAQAYDHNRLSELRIPGGSAVALASPTRGAGSETITSTELLQVKLRVQQQFEKTPNDPAIRQKRGEIAIVEHQAEEARREFEMAEALNPNLPKLKFDLASAYFELAETNQRPLDYARAIDFFGQYLQDVHQQDPVALFDRGLCWENEAVNAEAIKDFEAALALEKDAGWRKEIQLHLDKLKAQSALDTAAPTPLTPASLLAMQTESPGDYENYLDAAGREWLPHRNDPQTQQALQQLAMMGAKHDDLWLHDLLSTPADSAADIALSQALQSSAKGDADAANQASASAIQLYKRANNQPGALRAQAEHVYSLQRMGRGKDCLDEATPLLTNPHVSSYAWMHSYLQLEAASCNGSLGNPGAVLIELQNEISAANHANLPIVSLRGTGFMAEARLQDKDVQGAWVAGVAGLKQCYSVKKTFVRQYQFLYVLRRAADTLDLSWTRVGLADAAAAAAKSASNLQATAYAFEGLGVDQTKVGQLREATQNFDAADKTLARMAAGKALEQYRADLKIDRFALQAKESAELKPILQSISDSEPTYQKFDAFYPRLRYYTEYADVLRLSHRTTQSLQVIWNAIGSSEHSLAGIHTDAARQAWEEQAARSYQVLVLDLAADGQPQNALRAWEWFKGAAHRNAQPTSAAVSSDAAIAALPLIPDQAPRSLTLVYARLDDQYFAWSISSNRAEPIRMRVLSASAQSIDSKGLAFRRLCADPRSSMQDIATLGASLYQDLMSPFTDQIDQADSLDLDLDHTLSQIPFVALSHGNRPLAMQHAFIFLPDGWNMNQDLTDQSALADTSRTLVLREVAQANAAHIPGEYDESKEIARRIPGAKLESATLWRSGLNLNIAGGSTLQSDVAEADVLHYTGHGIEENKSIAPPGQSSFVVSGGSMLRCRLAVLAACRTFDQRENIAEDVPSFTRILLQAGAKNVIATQWDVDSRMTQKLMVRFYAELANHQTFAEALRRAQSSIQSDPAAAHPYFWSAFQLVGRPPTTVRGKT
jgi:CHAT domain-containing protein